MPAWAVPVRERIMLVCEEYPAAALHPLSRTAG